VLVNGRKVADAKGIVILERGDRILLRMPGGGGYGAPSERDPAHAKRDREMGYVS
jgi:N-methylhydantoinase B/oxoprolinase/acetone carboxylase alpha subunit